jgi:hypothetical protein
MMTNAKKILLAGFAAAALIAGTWGTSGAGLRFEAVYASEPVDVRVWLDRGDGYDYYDDDFDDDDEYYDVYPSAGDVTLYVRTARSCYTTVYVIDTEGFIHVVQPLSPHHDAFLIGGRVYRFRLSDYGFDWNCFGRGVAFAFAVTSPVPFGYAGYGLEVFGPRVGFQVYGDPFVAARLFYLSVLPATCSPTFASVGYARFYVREYVRYPSYLCLGWHHVHGDRSYCGGHCGAHRQYRIHAKSPFSVLRPDGHFAEEAVRYTKIDRTGMKSYSEVRARTLRPAPAAGAPVVRSKPIEKKEFVNAKRTARVDEPVAADRVVRSTKNTFVASKRNYEKMREAYRKVETRPAGRIELRPDRPSDAGTSKSAGRKISVPATKRAADSAARPSKPEISKRTSGTREPVAYRAPSSERSKEKPSAGKTTRATSKQASKSGSTANRTKS